MTNKTPHGARKHRSFFLSSFLYGLQSSLMLCESLAMVFAWNSSILYRAVHNPIAFSQLWSLTRHL